MPRRSMGACVAAILVAGVIAGRNLSAFALLPGLVVTIAIALRIIVDLQKSPSQLLTLDSPRESRPWSRKLGILVVLAIVLAVVVRAFLCEAYIVPGDCAGPEVPRGSRVLAWKLTSTYVPRDLVVYRFDGQTNLGRVVRNDGSDLIVNRNGEPDAKVAREAVIGKVICVYWRASAPPAEPGKTAGRATETPRASGQTAAPTAAAPITGTMPETSAADASTTKSPNTQKAQNEKIQAMQRALKIVEAQYRSGTAAPEECLAALGALLDAQLDAAKTKAERVAILQKVLDNQQNLEKITMARFQNGMCSEAEADKARAETLGAENPPGKGEIRRGRGESFAAHGSGRRAEYSEVATRAAPIAGENVSDTGCTIPCRSRHRRLRPTCCSLGCAS